MCSSGMFPHKNRHRGKNKTRLTSFCRYGNSIMIKTKQLSIFTLYSIHHSDVINSAMASQIIGVSIVYSTVCLGADQRKYQTSESLAFVMGVHGWPVHFVNTESLIIHVKENALQHGLVDTKRYCSLTLEILQSCTRDTAVLHYGINIKEWRHKPATWVYCHDVWLLMTESQPVLPCQAYF